MSTQVLFDKLSYIDRLKAAGVDDTVARAHADGLDQAFREEVATKTELNRVETALKADIYNLGTKIDALEQRLSTKIDLEISKASNSMLIKTGGMLSFIMAVALGVARYFGIIH